MNRVDRLKHAYEVWSDSRGENASVWLDLFAPDIVVRSLGGGDPAMKFSVTRHGPDEAREYFTALAEQWEMREFHADEFIAEGDRVVMVGHCAWRFRATGKTAESPIVHIWRFRDGLAVDFIEFYDTARAFAAAVPD